MDFSMESSKLPRPNRAHQQSNSSSGTLPPRLKSPPPALQHRPLVHSPRKLESSAPPTPSIVVERPTPVSTTSKEGVLEAEESPIKIPSRAPLRGKASPGSLETVQESSFPATPAISIGTSRSNKPGDSKLPSTIEENPMEEVSKKQSSKSAESGSDSAGSRATTVRVEAKDGRKPTTNNSAYRAPVVNTRRSFTHLNSSKGRVPTEGSVRNMTVETETVSSVPQMALGGAGERGLPGRSDAGGSLRLKPSSETIRPKKEKKKPARKTPSLAPGTGGLLSRRRHYHHSSTRTPSPNEKTALSTTPKSSHSPMSEHFHLSLTLSPGSEARVQAHRNSLECGLLSSSPKVSLASSKLTDRGPRLASSKADIFEAKVASAVGEADSEDSDETFVYESNPPEPHSGRPSRFHSRTPSAASTVSQVDHWGNRLRQDGNHSIAGKKSMKFTNNSYHTNGHQESADSPYQGGSTNSARTPGGNTSHHHHHIGRHGRGTSGYPSILDQQSPFPNVAKSYRTMNNSLRTSRPSSPRNAPTGRSSAALFKGNAATVYDLEAEAADDERTPLVGSNRSARTRYSRRPGSRNYGSDGGDRRSFYGRMTSCLLFGGLIGFLIAAVVVALVMVSKPLMDVHVKDLQNVLASEQEIMLDLHVHAINPNLVAIQVSDLDVFVYAKSRYVGTGEAWRKEHDTLPGGWENRTGPGYLDPRVGSGRGDSDPGTMKANDGVDEGNDPIEDPEGDSHLMLLGSIYHFDSPLVFDASPIRHSSQSSVGELRLGKPGNSSEEGGTERWERVLEHPFELIVRGVLHYSLPISSGVQSAKISGSVMVQPQAGSQVLDEIQGLHHDHDYASGRSRWRGKGIEFRA